jgi:hypothetical protein
MTELEQCEISVELDQAHIRDTAHNQPPIQSLALAACSIKLLSCGLKLKKISPTVPDTIGKVDQIIHTVLHIIVQSSFGARFKDS